MEVSRAQGYKPSLLYINILARMDSAAEQLFSDITDKDGWTYEALIEGLVKVSATMCLCHADHS